MADDIVDRLREGAEYEHDTATMADAADEIEKLRAELDKAMRIYEFTWMERETKAKEAERLAKEVEEMAALLKAQMQRNKGVNGE